MKNTIINMLHYNICIKLKENLCHGRGKTQYATCYEVIYIYLHVKHKQKNQINSKLECG